MAKIDLSNSEIEEIMNGLDIAKGECNCYKDIFKKFEEKFQNDLNMCYLYMKMVITKFQKMHIN